MNIRFVSEGARVVGVEKAALSAAKAVLRHGRVTGTLTLNVIWTTREKVRLLNRRFRGKNRFTDVIAFRYEDSREFPAQSPFSFRKGGKSFPRKEGNSAFGDIFIAVEQARMNARQFGVRHSEELLRLVVHGTLHLLGYTDYVPREKKKMWDVQEPIVRRFVRRLPRS